MAIPNGQGTRQWDKITDTLFHPENAITALCNPVSAFGLNFEKAGLKFEKGSRMEYDVPFLKKGLRNVFSGKRQQDEIRQGFIHAHFWEV